MRGGIGGAPIAARAIADARGGRLLPAGGFRAGRDALVAAGSPGAVARAIGARCVMAD